MPKPMPWSHSALEAHNTCPRQYEQIKVLRNFQDTKNEAALWGDSFHKQAEKYIRDAAALKSQGLTYESAMAHLALHGMESYTSYLEQFLARPGAIFAERQYALTKALVPCDFFAKDVWCRGIIDVLTLDGTVAYVDDHKTGKNRKKDMQQLIIFALLTFYHHPEIQTVHTAFHWTQLKAKDSETFYRHQIPTLWEKLLPKLQSYMAAFHSGVFPPKPSGLCKKHCAVSDCEYHGRGSR